jgi:hypothetical protein
MAKRRRHKVGKGRKTSWSHPYHGVQHLLGTSKAYQLTVEDRGSSADASVLHRHSDHPFTPAAEKTFKTAAEARRWCEKRPEAKA